MKRERTVALTVRILGSAVSITGLFVLVSVLCDAVTGSLAAELFSRSSMPSSFTWFALGLSLPVPFHVMSVGLVVQRRWLSPVWGRAAWIGTAVSGCWLGVALAVKLFLEL